MLCRQFRNKSPNFINERTKTTSFIGEKVKDYQDYVIFLTVQQNKRNSCILLKKDSTNDICEYILKFVTSKVKITSMSTDLNVSRCILKQLLLTPI